MVVKGTHYGNKRKIDDVLLSTTTTAFSRTPTPQSSPKNCCPTTASPPISAKLNNAIPRPRAQRKFAQGVIIPSPPVTPYKIPKTVTTPVKKIRIPQYSPPIKRPKTEDFLTFLCYRGTPALPKSLNFFNYPSHYDRVTDFVKVKSRNEIKSWRKNSRRATQMASTSSTTQRSQGQSGSDLKPNQSFKFAQKTTTSSKPSRSIEAINKEADKDKELSKVLKKSTTQSSTTVSSSIPSASLRKQTHINEQDAQFAISALKLKYQEKRLANPKQILSVASKLAKKVKDRRVILTRSKSRDETDVQIAAGPKSNVKKLKTVIYSKQEVSRRNAPSPDIIDVVKLKLPPNKDYSSSEGDSSESDCSSKSSSTKVSAVDMNVRSLRSGRKAILDKANLNSKRARSLKVPVPIPNRVSTRASRRNTTSPLRELPMYGVMKKRKKQLKKDKSSSRRKKSIAKEPEKDKSSPSGSTRRPSRKTKESAAFFLNFITNNFSSDDNDHWDKNNEKSDGDSSSSETKSLETRYKAIMKRDEQKGSGAKRSEDKSSKNKKPPVKKKSQRETKLEKRILRSESSRKVTQQRAVSPRTTRNAKRRATVPLPSSAKPFHAGAARKSASVFPKKNKRFSSSSSHSSSSDDDSSSSSSSSSTDSDTEENKSKDAKPRRSERSRKPAKHISRKLNRNTDTEGESGSESGDNEESQPLQRSCSTSVTQENLFNSGEDSHRAKSESSSSAISGTDSDTSTSEDEEIIEKVDIAIQVDMDLEDLAQEAASTGQQTEDPPPPVLTPHFMSQGCQSEFPPLPLPPRSSPVHMPRSHQPQPITLTHPPSQIPLPPHPPSLLPFPGQSFYPTLTNFEFISQQRTQQDFSVMLPTIGLPTVSTYSFGPSTVLNPNQIPIGYSSTSISAATTLQTHIRSVAANLDIPLVRPVVTQQTNLLTTMPLTRPSQIDPHRPLTRPVVKPWPDTGSLGSQAPQNPQHYSAFRVPVSTAVINGPTSAQRLMSAVSNESYSTTPHTGYQRFQSQPVGPHGVNSTRVSGRSGLQGQRPVTPNLVTAHPGISAHGLSLIQSLPNVSIVPKFDRTAKPIVIHPDQQPTSSSSSPEKLASKKVSKIKEKNGPPKEKGRKRKILPFEKAPSPLLVRKDSTNPITYVGTSKKNAKGKEPLEHVKNAASEQTRTSQFNQLVYQNNTVEDNITSGASDPTYVEKSGIQHNLDDCEDSEKCSISKSPEKDTDKGSPLANSESSKLDVQTSSKLAKSKSGDTEKKSREAEDAIPKRRSSKKPEQKSTGKKGGTESSRPASVSSERSSRVSESHDEIKIDDISAYYPTEEEFQDPFKYIQQIREEAQQFGIARIVPPKSFRPECNVEDDMRFTAYNHYIHRMHKRWGTNVHVRVGIMENLRKSKVRVTAANPPIIGGMEIDLTTLYHTVQSFGGLTEVIQKDKWNKVSDAMNIPKAANDRATKLDAIYVKYVLPYEMLSDNERRKLSNEVEKKWKVRLSKDPEGDTESDEDDPLVEFEDCIIKGKSTPLSSYYRVARNTMNMLFKNKEPTHEEVESAYWKLVRERDRHLCVYSGSIDCAGLGWGFPLPKGGTKHPWNLKVLANNPSSILKSMGPVMGATVPTLHVGMVFTTYCWYRDPHNLPWVEYLHSGGNKIWYVIPESQETNFRQVLKDLMPRQCKDKQIWLTSDSAMVPPELLLNQGIPLYRAVQNPGEFLVVFPKAFTSAICTGYVISESVCFATSDWLRSSLGTFRDIRESKEPPVFPLEKLVLSILTDTRVSNDILKTALPVAEHLFKEEIALRKKLRELGVVGTQKTIRTDEKGRKNIKKGDDEVQECDTCNYVLHLSMVTNKSKKVNYCLPHAVEQLVKNKSRVKASSLLYTETDAQLRSILDTAQSRLTLRRNQ